MAISLSLWEERADNPRVKESPVKQSPSETVQYDLTTTNVGSTPTSPTVTVTDMTRNLTVTSTVLSGSATVSGDVLTFKLTAMIENHSYRANIRFTIGTEVYERYLIVRCGK